MDDPQKVARVFRALSSETRVRILRMLKQQALCVGALAARLDITSAAVSQHLRILREADLVVPDKRGYYVHYLLNRETLEEWRQVADDLLTADEE
ncbi:MAG: metalloregulator ArsR/SmtB family transcription factor [Candidatus Brocadiia bacterium]